MNVITKSPYNNRLLSESLNQESGFEEKNQLPVIDLFAGPGGLGEGFASEGFDVVLSCEMDATACKTLILRKFFHQFKDDDIPSEYYEVIKGQKNFESLRESHPKQYFEAHRKVMRVKLGDKKLQNRVHSRIHRALESSPFKENFVLVGGPPCQAYSLAGRSRRLGLGKNHTRGKDNKRITIENLPKEVADHKKALADEFYNDPKHQLYLEYLEIIAVHNPAIFVMENVKGITSARQSSKEEKGGAIFQKIISDLRCPGMAVENDLPIHIKKKYNFDRGVKYRLVSTTTNGADELTKQGSLSGSSFVVRSENYGIPQTRHRVFIVGIREDIVGRPDFLEPTTSQVSVREMIGTMPKLRSGVSKIEDSSNNWASSIRKQYEALLKDRIPNNLLPPKLIEEIAVASDMYDRGSEFVPINKNTEKSTACYRFECTGSKSEIPPAALTWLSDHRIGGVINHSTRSHMASDLARYLFCSAYAQYSKAKKSPKLEEWPTTELLPKHANVKSSSDDIGNVNIVAESHSDRFRVQIWDKPATTIVSHISKDGHYFIHPDPVQCRSLTVREAARLQTFPDNYYFFGGRTAQYQQVGNAVPPFLAKQIAENIRLFLTKEPEVSLLKSP